MEYQILSTAKKKEIMSKLKHGDLTEKIIGTFYEVYNELGFGFLESVYEEALKMALEEKGFNVKQQVSIPVWFRGKQIGDFDADLIVNELVILELKAVRKIVNKHEAQLLNYLRATKMEVGLLLNFGQSAEFKRLVFDNYRKKNQLNAKAMIANLLEED